MATKILCFLFTSLLFSLRFPSSVGQNAVRAAYWFPESEFPVSKVDSTLFTHLFCAFADLNNLTNQVTISSKNQAQFSNFTQTLQQKNPSIKTLLSIGGGSSRPLDFASMATQPSSRKYFIDSSIRLARSYNFHGLDLDWQYPSSRTEMTNLGLLLNEWRAAVAMESTTTGRSPLLLSAAVFRSSDYYNIDYPFKAISDSLDWVNVMSYDFYMPKPFTVTRPHAALYNPETQVSADNGIKSWIRSGVSAKKLVLGFPFYGYAWKLSDPNNNGFLAPANGPALSTDGDGDVSYWQIKDFISKNSATTVYNLTVVSNYCYSGTTWIGFDDTNSIAAKVSYVTDNGLLGYFAWHVGADQNWALSQIAARTWEASMVGLFTLQHCIVL